ncbi:unnamed protein product [Staurois parvus]|uniref:Uncharacterized protein n=1 Tax=Staurois parvus TaxID=386267 RepID=A0ABN9DEC2_9NEOB|nr:unnamed protein product [Staurois parvus]
MQYMLAFMVPSMNCSSPPQTMTLPPPCLTVGKTHLSLYSSPGCRHTRLTPSEPNNFILVSLDPAFTISGLPQYTEHGSAIILVNINC